ncbi:MAG: hypothetical protein EKK54_00165 [Neisseriaceae bacterium]|nr:MAG: hypothetical protein EKK54_00165 [Neisseriaceae bacterium]
MIMLSTTSQLMEYSIATEYLMNNMGYLVVAGGLSYNIPQLFKLKSESGYMIRAGIMSAASLAIIPTAMILPESYPMGLKLIGWGCSFIAGMLFATYGARKLQAKFSLFFSKFTVKNNIRKGSKTDIRYMAKELPAIPQYNPLKYINLKKGIFVGLDEQVKPIYLKNLEDWYKKHFLIVGATRSGKGVAMQYLGIQSLMLGEKVVFLDPKGDKYMPHIFKAQCNDLGVPYHYIDLTQDIPQINLIADFNSRDLKNCLVEAFSQREMGSESDVYRKNEQEFLENLAKFIFEQNQSVNSATTGEAINGSNYFANDGDRINNNRKSLADICKDYDIERYADKYKSSVSDLNKLLNVAAINAANGKSLSELLAGGGCIYIVGDLLDETMKKIQRFIFCRIVQLARNHANGVFDTNSNSMLLDSVNQNGANSNMNDNNHNEERNITVFADELVAHICRFVAESYTVTLGWNLKIVSAIQDLKLLRGAPADLDPEYLKGAVFGNSQNKLFYRADDIDTADFLSDMTGRIQIEEEQKLVTRNSLNSEKLDKQTRLIQSERNYFDRNMILNLKQFEAVFCSSLPYRKTIASLCKTSPVKVTSEVNGKQLIKPESKDNSENHLENNTHDYATNERYAESPESQVFLNGWQKELAKHRALIDEITQSGQAKSAPQTNLAIADNQQTKFASQEQQQTKTNQKTNIDNLNGEYHANQYSESQSESANNNAARNSQNQKASTAKSDYLF